MPEDNDNKPNPTQSFQNLLDKFSNDGVKLAAQLFDDNYSLREKNRELKDKLPKDGSLVLAPDEAKEYGKLKTFLDGSNLDLKQIKEMSEKYPELEKHNKQLANTETIYELSEIGLDGTRLKRGVLKEQLFDKFPEAVVSFKDEKDKDGKPVKNAYITLEGKESSFTEFANEKLADYLPALKAEQAQAPPMGGNTPDPKPSGAGNSVFDRIRQKVKSQEKAEVRSIDEAFGRAA